MVVSASARPCSSTRCQEMAFGPSSVELESFTEVDVRPGNGILLASHFPSTF